ncbi:predicted protein [Aspergillus udagawae]|nr:predicted protein [Aspergillus udagawae]
MTAIPPMIKIMILNPIGEQTLNGLFAGMARNYKAPHTHVTVASLSLGAGSARTLLYPATRSLIFAELVRACLQAREEKYHVVIVNCFFDLLIDELRQIAGGMIIIGPGQAAIETALRLGKRYSIIVPSEVDEHSTDPLIRDLWFKYKPVSYRSIGMIPGKDIYGEGGDVSQLEERLYAQGRLAVESDGADILILGCTLGLGLFQGLMQAVNVPVIDAAVAALKTAELSAQMKEDYGWGTSRPSATKIFKEEEIKDLGFFHTPYEFSGRVEIK